MLVALTLLGTGIALLYVGATFLVRGSSGLARALGAPPAVIGLTVVGFGTSAPELMVSVTAGLKGNADIALGNVVGSNIANVGLVLGVGAALRSITVEFTLLKREAPLGLAAVALVVGLSLDGVLGRTDGVLLLVGFLWFLAWSLFRERAAPAQVQEGYAQVVAPAGRPLRNAFTAALGLAGVLLGAYWLVEGGVTVASVLGVPAAVIGLTVVAVGTSLPELAASLVAVSRGEDDISVGNVLGSNLFNLLGILGVAAVLDPIRVAPTFLRFQYPVLAAFTLALLPIMRIGMGISRAEGVLLLGGYAAYVAVLYLVPELG